MRLRIPFMIVMIGLGAMFASFTMFTPEANAGGIGPAPCDPDETSISLGNGVPADISAPTSVHVNGDVRIIGFHTNDDGTARPLIVDLCILPTPRQHMVTTTTNVVVRTRLPLRSWVIFGTICIIIGMTVQWLRSRSNRRPSSSS